jgi:GTP cyclohydrolase I
LNDFHFRAAETPMIASSDSLRAATAVRRGAPPAAAVDLPRIERAVREILAAIGEDPDREGLVETPARVAKAYRDLTAGLRDDAARHLGKRFDHTAGSVHDVVAVRDVRFHSLCEHHLLPFFGTVHVAYLPAGRKVVGLSKLARTVEVFARRPQMQERLTGQIADALVEHLGPRGVAVIAESRHLCMGMRGACQPGADMLTTAVRGVYAEDVAARKEIFHLLTSRGRGGVA